MTKAETIYWVDRGRYAIGPMSKTMATEFASGLDCGVVTDHKPGGKRLVDPVDLKRTDQQRTLRLEELRDEIRGCIKETGLSILRAGQRLIEARIILEGGFTRWVEDECEVSIRTAENFMGLARRFQERPEIISCLPATALYSLASDRVSDRVIDVIADKALQGERMKVREVKALIEAEYPAPKRSGSRKTVEQHIEAAAAAVLEVAQASGFVPVAGESVAPTPGNVQAAITEQAAEGVRADGERLAQQIEREQGLTDDAKYTGVFTVVSASARNGFVTLSAPKLAEVLKAGQKGTYVIYVKVEALN